MKLFNKKSFCSFFLCSIYLGSHLCTVDAARKCGTWATEDCLGDIDKRYDPDTSPNLVDLHPLYEKMDGYWVGTQTSYDANKNVWQARASVPYMSENADAFVNITVSGTRFYQHEIYVLSKAPQTFCESELPTIPDSPPLRHVWDDGVCGVNGVAAASDIFRTSTHELNEISVTIGGTGDQACQVWPAGNCEGFGQPVEDKVFYTSQFHNGDSEDDNSIAHVHLLIFSEDFQSFRVEKTFYRDINNQINIFAEMYADFKKVSESAYLADIQEKMNDKNVTQATQASILSKLPLEAGVCLRDPCPTEDDWATADPNLSKSPYEEKYQVKSGVVAGFTVTGALLLIIGIVIYYQWTIYKIKESAKKKFASRMATSTHNLVSGKDSAGVTPKDLIDTFNSIDCGVNDGGDGLISKDELWAYVTSTKGDNVKKIDSQMTRKEFDVLFDTIDKDKSEKIDFTEFCAFIAELNRS